MRLALGGILLQMRWRNRLAEGLVAMGLIAGLGLMMGGERMGRFLGIDEVPRGVALIEQVGPVKFYAAASRLGVLGIIVWRDNTDVVSVGFSTREGLRNERRSLTSEIPLMKP